jgi:hypothetical protein
MSHHFPSNRKELQLLSFGPSREVIFCSGPTFSGLSILPELY